MKYVLSVLALLSLVASSQVGFSNTSQSWEKKIGVSLRSAKIAALNSKDIIVILAARANLSSSHQLLTKQAKGAFVVRSLQAVAEKSQEDLAHWLTERGLKFKRFYIMNAIAVEGATPALIKQIAQRDEVRKIIADPVVKSVRAIHEKQAKAGDSHVNAVGVNITSTGAEAVWARGFEGQGIVVAGQDTGVEWNHPALVSHYRGSTSRGAEHQYNWHDSIHETISGSANPCGLDIDAPCDDYGHGTHTVGTMIGSDGGANSIGMAPQAQWIACRNMDNGYGKPSTYIECYEWLIAPYIKGASSKEGDPSKAPHVINNSWSCPLIEGCEGEEIKPVVEAVYHAGIVNVVSAGNEGPGCMTIKDQPASLSDFGFSVGAHNHRTNSIASFSSRGPSAFDGKVGPDITGPGVMIRSAIPGSGYSEAWSGTSMAGPHVAGAVALLWSAQPKLIGNVDATIAVLEQTAVKTVSAENCGGVSGTTIPNNTFGYGRLDVDAAVKRALELE